MNYMKKSGALRSAPDKGEGFSVLSSGPNSAERIRCTSLLSRVAIFAHHIKRFGRDFVPSDIQASFSRATVTKIDSSGSGFSIMDPVCWALYKGNCPLETRRAAPSPTGPSLSRNRYLFHPFKSFAKSLEQLLVLAKRPAVIGCAT